MKKKTGRPLHIPTEANRKVVMIAVGMGACEDDVAQELGIDAKTLRKHYREDLDQAAARFATKLRIRAGVKALNGDRTMQIFLLKTRCGFKEVNWNEHSGEDGGPVRIIISNDDSRL